MSNYYREYSPYLVERYGERVYKVPITLAGRDMPESGRYGGDWRLYFLRCPRLGFPVSAGNDDH